MAASHLSSTAFSTAGRCPPEVWPGLFDSIMSRLRISTPMPPCELLHDFYSEKFRGLLFLDIDGTAVHTFPAKEILDRREVVDYVLHEKKTPVLGGVFRRGLFELLDVATQELKLKVVAFSGGTRRYVELSVKEINARARKRGVPSYISGFISQEVLKALAWRKEIYRFTSRLDRTIIIDDRVDFISRVFPNTILVSPVQGHSVEAVVELQKTDTVLFRVQDAVRFLFAPAMRQIDIRLPILTSCRRCLKFLLSLLRHRRKGSFKFASDAADMLLGLSNRIVEYLEALPSVRVSKSLAPKPESTPGPEAEAEAQDDSSLALHGKAFALPLSDTPFSGALCVNVEFFSPEFPGMVLPLSTSLPIQKRDRGLREFRRMLASVLHRDTGSLSVSTAPFAKPKAKGTEIGEGSEQIKMQIKGFSEPLVLIDMASENQITKERELLNADTVLCVPKRAADALDIRIRSSQFAKFQTPCANGSM